MVFLVKSSSFNGAPWWSLSWQWMNQWIFAYWMVTRWRQKEFQMSNGILYSGYPQECPKGDFNLKPRLTVSEDVNIDNYQRDTHNKMILDIFQYVLCCNDSLQLKL